MRITIKHHRRDGKMLVALTFDHGVTLRKVLTPEQLQQLRNKHTSTHGS